MIKLIENSDKEGDEYEMIRKKKRNTFVGTAEYVSPEVLNDSQISSECDLWALGCIIYRCLVGKTPFKDKTEYLIFENIRKNKINFPEVKNNIIIIN
jgi:serine/threonine protein kinase